MKYDKEFLSILKNTEQRFAGWDFSYISGTGRMRSGLVSWSYASMALPLIQQSSAMLDMGTGGGEFLSMLRPFPKISFATEGYEPNIPIARDRLEPLGVKVLEVKEDKNLPLDTEQFDLVLNQHESFCATEVRRVLKPDGIFLTQQVGGLDCSKINEALGAPLTEEQERWNLDEALSQLNKANFKVYLKKEEYPIQRFYDVGALVYYLNAIPWQIQDFKTENFLDGLFEIHKVIKDVGYFDVKQHRFIIQAKVM